MSNTRESSDRPVPVMPLGEHELGATATQITLD